MSDFKPVVGIDLGTTFSAIAYIDEHQKPIVIPNEENIPITPSVVNFADKDTFVVGEEAANKTIADNINTVSFIKREMGKSDYKLTIHDREYTPQDISAKILAKLKKDAETYFRNNGLEIEIKDAVITVPAYFGMNQKNATIDAGKIAGLNVLYIINEPTAAALAFGINNIGKDQTVFVFDLGGGTFDVTILEIKGNTIDMIASEGNARLGGKNWDDLLVNYCSQLFKDKYGKNPKDDADYYQELYERILKSKISLSRLSKTVIPINYEGNKMNVEVTREKFEELSKDLVYQCKCLSEHVLNKAGKNGMTWNDIDKILLVGGSTYMPMVRNMIKEISGKEPSTDVNPDQCVAVGAAWKAFLEQTGQKVEEVRKLIGDEEAEKTQKAILGHLPPIDVIESVAKSLGVIAHNEKGKEAVFKMIPEQTKIPCLKEDASFTYYEDNQTSLCVRVTEGEGDAPDEVNIIGQIILDNLPPRRKGSPIKLKYNYNENKILEIEVVDVETGKSKQGMVVFGGALSDAEIQESIRHHAGQQQE